MTGLGTAQHTAIAAELAAAGRDRRTIPLLSARWPQMDVEDSYAVQELWARSRQADGRRIVGRKIGLTSRVMQQATGIDEPDYGTIFNDQVHASGSVIDFDAFSNVRVEVELAFRVKTSLGGTDVSPFDVLDAIDVVAPALEILSSRVELTGRTIVDTIADNAALGAVVLGAPAPLASVPDLASVGGVLYRNECVEDSGVAAAVLGHPLRGVEWLARRLAGHGRRIEAGEFVVAGSFTKPMWVARGDVVFADYGSLGVVSCRFQ